jgi:hypothetical protein
MLQLSTHARINNRVCVCVCAAACTNYIYLAPAEAAARQLFHMKT